MINSYAAFQPKSKLEPFSFEKKEIGANEVEIQITHCGICHSDIHLIDNDWMISKYPLVPGHEVIGNIISIGSNVSNLKVGQRVGVGWQSGSCFQCEQCKSGNENLCSTSVATCVGRYGGFAEKIITDHRFAFPIPEELESENAAPLLCAGITVFSPMKIFGLQRHHKVGVIGIGGLGHLAIQFASKMGCKVSAFSSSIEKKSEAINFGADDFIDSRDEKILKSLYAYFDFIITTVTAPLNWSLYINMLKPNGRLNFVGATVGNIEINPGILVSGQKSISGSAIGSRGTMIEMLNFASENNIKAKTELVHMSDCNDAIQKVRDNKARYRMVLHN